MKVPFCYFLALLVVHCHCQIPRIILLEPINATIFALRKNTSRSPVAIRYNILELSSSTIEICIQLENADNAEKLLPSTCFPATDEGETKALTDLPLGNFGLSLVLQGIVHPKSVLEGSRVDATFSVKKIAELLPKITVSRLTYFSASEQAAVIVAITKQMAAAAVAVDWNVANVLVEYQLSESLIPMDGFDICAKLMTTNSALESIEVFQGCSPSTHLFVKLHDLAVGSYALTLVLAHTSDPEEAILKSERVDYDSSTVTLQMIIRNLADAEMSAETIVTEESRKDHSASSDQDLSSSFQPLPDIEPDSLTFFTPCSDLSSSIDHYTTRTEANKTYVLPLLNLSEIENDSNCTVTTRKRVLGSSILGLIMSASGSVLVRSSHSELLSPFIRIFRRVTISSSMSMSMSDLASVSESPGRLLKFVKVLLEIFSRMVLRITSLPLFDTSSSSRLVDYGLLGELSGVRAFIGSTPVTVIDIISSIRNFLHPVVLALFETVSYGIGWVQGAAEECRLLLSPALQAISTVTGLDLLLSSCSPIQLFCFFVVLHTLLFVISSLIVCLKIRKQGK
jgi:hypothetical protein